MFLIVQEWALEEDHLGSVTPWRCIVLSFEFLVKRVTVSWWGSFQNLLTLLIITASWFFCALCLFFQTLLCTAGRSICSVTVWDSEETYQQLVFHKHWLTAWLSLVNGVLLHCFILQLNPEILSLPWLPGKLDAHSSSWNPWLILSSLLPMSQLWLFADIAVSYLLITLGRIV